MQPPADDSPLPDDVTVRLDAASPAVREAVPAEVLAGQRYAIGAQVARGGMGAILEAQQNAMGRRVAMKVMLDGAEAADVARFVDEAKITGQLEHPNIVPVHELGIDDASQLFYTMKFVRGITLKKVLELLAAGTEATVAKYPLLALLTIFQKTCDAIAFAHSRGVIHRDLKPENIMLGDFGEVLVMDWGLAKVLAGRPAAGASAVSFGAVSRGFISTTGSSHTMAGAIMGTPGYMAPEQARGEVDTLDQRADIYSLGAILFEILHLRPAFSGTDPWAIVASVARGAVEWNPPRKGVADSLLAVCRKALALDRAQRYAGVEALQADLTAYQNGFATSAEDAGWWKRAGLAIKRNKAVAAGAAAVLLVGTVLGTQAILEGLRAEREAAVAKRALADLRKQVPALHQLAESEANQQRLDSALEKFDAALALDPDYCPSLWRRGWVLVGLERFAEAAAALRLAWQKEPNRALDPALLPLLDRMSRASSDAERWPPGASDVLFSQLGRLDLHPEIARLSAKLRLGKDDLAKLVKQRVVAWLGARDVAGLDEQGRIELKLYGRPINSLEPLRGLPIEVLMVSSTQISDLEPLRGMPLQIFDADKTGVADLSPLQGAPLSVLKLNSTKVADLSPIKGAALRTLELNYTRVRSLEPVRGAPLRILRARDLQIPDLEPVRGAPLEILELIDCPVRDLSPLKAAPMRELNTNIRLPFERLDFLAGSRIERLSVSGALDLSSLRGKPLKFLDLRSTKLTDLSPLAESPLEELNIACPAITDFRPLLRVTTLRHLSVSRECGKLLEPLRQHSTVESITYSGPNAVRTPVTKFWAEYDAQQAGK